MTFDAKQIGCGYEQTNKPIHLFIIQRNAINCKEKLMKWPERPCVCVFVGWCNAHSFDSFDLHCLYLRIYFQLFRNVSAVIRTGNFRATHFHYLHFIFWCASARSRQKTESKTAKSVCFRCDALVTLNWLNLFAGFGVHRCPTETKMNIEQCRNRKWLFSTNHTISQKLFVFHEKPRSVFFLLFNFNEFHCVVSAIRFECCVLQKNWII